MSQQRMTLKTWLIVAGAWVAYALLMTYQTYFAYAKEGVILPLSRIIVPVSAYTVSWFLLTPLVFRLAKKYPLERGLLTRRLSFHLAASLVISLSQRFFSDSVTMLIRATAEHPFSFDRLLGGVVGYFDYGLLVYWIIVLIVQGFGYYRKAKEEQVRVSQLQTKLVETRLQALRSQLHPHFLFNTLNSISALVHVDVEAADRMIARLGDFLRLTLEHSGEQMSTIRAELEAIRAYVDIEKVRFQGALVVEVDVEPEALDAAVPAFLWQPVLENAIHHGVATSEHNGRIYIRARVRNGTLVLEVQDNGRGLSGAVKGQGYEGIGLSHTRAILHELYGSSFRFDVGDAPEGGVLASFELPFTKRAPAPDVDGTFGKRFPQGHGRG